MTHSKTPHNCTYYRSAVGTWDWGRVGWSEDVVGMGGHGMAGGGEDGQRGAGNDMCGWGSRLRIHFL